MTTDSSRALFVVSFATGLSLLGDTSLYTVLATHTADAGVALASVGILLSANRFIRLALNGPIGWLCDRWPRRRVFVPAVFLGAASTAIYALTSGFLPLLVGRLLWGVAWAALWVSGNAIVLDITGARSRGRQVGIYHFAFFLGAASGSFLGGLLTDWIGFNGAMAVNAVLSGTGAVAALVLLPETAGIGLEEATEKTPPRQRIDAKASNGQLISSVALFGINRVVGAGIFFSTFALFLPTVLGDNFVIAGIAPGMATLTGLALSATTLTSMASAPLSGILSDRLSSRWPAVAAGLGAGVAGFLTLALATPMAVLFGTPMISISSGSNQGLSTSLLGDFSPQERQGRYLGILFTVGDLGSAIGPPIAFALLPHVGLPSLYVACSALLGVMLAVALRWHLLARKAAPMVR